jgi:hypothetical protein
MSDNNKDDGGHNGRPPVTPTPNKRVRRTGLQMLVNAGSIYDMRNSSTRSSTTTGRPYERPFGLRGCTLLHEEKKLCIETIIIRELSQFTNGFAMKYFMHAAAWNES